MDKTPESQIKSWLVQVSLSRGATKQNYEYNCIEALLIDYGQFMQPGKPLKPAQLGTIKHCYLNTQKLVKKNPSLVYCEGYVIPKVHPLPIYHAWSINSQKQVIDPTLRQVAIAYFGIAFNFSWVCDFLNIRNKDREQVVIAVLEGNYLEGFSLLRDGMPEDAITRIQAENE